MGEIEMSTEEYYEAIVKQTLKEQYKLDDYHLAAAGKRFAKLTESGIPREEAEQKLYEGMGEEVSSITDKEGWVQKVQPEAKDIYKTPEKPDTK